MNNLTLWVDADALPKSCKEVIIKQITRTNTRCVFVANKYIVLPNFNLLTNIVVDGAPDAADNYIVMNISCGDIVITADIPLAARAVSLNAMVINPRGKIYTSANINSILATRNLLTDLRNDGIITGGPATFTKDDLISFTNSVNKLL